MITLLPLSRVIALVAILYAALISIILTAIAQQSIPNDILGSIRIALAGSTVLSLLLLFVFHVGWKWLWKRVPLLNKVVFPNLEGKWKMTIHYVAGEKSDSVVATATIKQDFVKLSMEVDSPGSESKTLIAQPKKHAESGTPLLYYVYQVDPKHLGPVPNQSYNGSAILRYSSEGTEKLEGNYFTSRNTFGRFTLTRLHE